MLKSTISSVSKRIMLTFLLDFPKYREPFVAKEYMPAVFEHPDALFNFQMRISENPTINFIEIMKRKANLLQTEYRGKNKPRCEMVKVIEKFEKSFVLSDRPTEAYDLDP
jgi:hypothetical protein